MNDDVQRGMSRDTYVWIDTGVPGEIKFVVCVTFLDESLLRWWEV